MTASSTNDGCPSAHGTPGAPGRTRGDVPRILLVEDDPQVRRFMERALLRNGYSVRCVASGTTAVKQLSKTFYDMILTDVRIPGPSGIALLEHCMTISPTTIVILITGNPKLSDAVATVKQGAFDYLAKPIAAKDLIAKVEEALQERGRDLTETLSQAQQPGVLNPEEFNFVRRLGAGTSGLVLLLEREGQFYAAKILRGGTDFQLDDASRERFRREAELVSRIKHPAVVPVIRYDISPEQPVPYILMQYVEGHPLSHYIMSSELELDQKVDLIRQVAEALEEAHRTGVIHRDIKPANILVTPELQAKITDFGVARLGSPDPAAAPEYVGSPAYMAPECCTVEAEVDFRADIFSLGTVAYELILGVHPFSGENVAEMMHEICQARPHAPRSLLESFPPGLEAILGRMLQKLPRNRYQSTKDLVMDLKRHTADPAELHAAENAEQRPRPWQ